jgi:hypothetical protein
VGFQVAKEKTANIMFPIWFTRTEMINEKASKKKKKIITFNMPFDNIPFGVVAI